MSITARHPVGATVGYTHASSVIAAVSPSDAEFGTVTLALVPLNTSAFPYRPAVVHVAPLSVPVLLFPDASMTVVPEPSLNPYAATRPVGGGGWLNVVALAMSEYPLRFPPASVARTR